MNNCNICKKEIPRKPYHRPSSYMAQKTCSLKCRGEYIARIRRAKWKPKRCLYCKEYIRKRVSNRIYCDDPCMRKHRVGENSPNWKGGRKMHGEYTQVAKKGHPFADMHGYIFEHRIIIEDSLRRRHDVGEDVLKYVVFVDGEVYLSPQVKVHHKNHKKSDNRIENLHPMLSQKEHFHFNYCPRCTHCNKSGELLENPGKDNQQPS